MSDADLLKQFVNSFHVYDKLLADHVSPELDDGRDDSQWARQKWKPAAIATDPGTLGEIYAKLPGQFPPLTYTTAVASRYCNAIRKLA